MSVTSPTTSAAVNRPDGTSRAGNAALWVLQIGLAAVFLMAGSSKLAGAEYAVVAFDAIGLGQWFRYLTGGLEVLGAVALLAPPVAGLGALLLACVMAGAVATHLFVVGGSPAAAAVFLALSILVAFGRRGRTARLLGS